MTTSAAIAFRITNLDFIQRSFLNLYLLKCCGFNKAHSHINKQITKISVIYLFTQYNFSFLPPYPAIVTKFANKVKGISSKDENYVNKFFLGINFTLNITHFSQMFKVKTTI